MLASQKQAETVSFALAYAQADREGSATQLVKVSIIGAKGVRGHTCIHGGSIATNDNTMT